MLKKSLLKLAFIVPVFAGLSLMSSTPVTLSGDDVKDEVKQGVVLDKTTHDFGTVKEDGGIITAVFIVTNYTNEAIILTSVKASCGCTTPSWTKEPIEPGKTGEIKASYNPKGRPGPFTKTITATTNTDEKIVMTIKGTVVAE